MRARLEQATNGAEQLSLGDDTNHTSKEATILDCSSEVKAATDNHRAAFSGTITGALHHRITNNHDGRIANCWNNTGDAVDAGIEGKSAAHRATGLIERGESSLAGSKLISTDNDHGVPSDVDYRILNSMYDKRGNADHHHHHIVDTINEADHTMDHPNGFNHDRHEMCTASASVSIFSGSAYDKQSAVVDRTNGHYPVRSRSPNTFLSHLDPKVDSIPTETIRARVDMCTIRDDETVNEMESAT